LQQQAVSFFALGGVDHHFRHIGGVGAGEEIGVAFLRHGIRHHGLYGKFIAQRERRVESCPFKRHRIKAVFPENNP